MHRQMIYIVEDDESIRELVKYALESEGFEVRAFDRAETVPEAFASCPPELILLDIMLPEMDGIELLSLIRSKYKNLNVRIIMLTAKSSEINKVTGLNGGADDYITKPFSVLELVARVKANLRKYAVASGGGILSYGDLKINAARREVFIADEKINLTIKEFALLKVFVENVNNIIERDDLLKRVWGYDYCGQTRTLDIHVKTLRGKIGRYGDNIITVRGVGYGFRESGQ